MSHQISAQDFEGEQHILDLASGPTARESRKRLHLIMDCRSESVGIIYRVSERKLSGQTYQEFGTLAQAIRAYNEL